MNTPQASTKRSNRSTIGIWIVSLGSVSVAALIATAFAMMAFGLDPSDIVTAGAEPWTNALTAAVAFGGLVSATCFSLWLWHFTRFRSVALILAAIEAGSVAWACVAVYADYF